MPRKSLFITGSMSNRLMRLARQKRIVTAVPTADTCVQPLDRSILKCETLGLGDLMDIVGQDNRPLELLAPDPSSRCWIRGVQTHVLSTGVPSGSFLEIRKGLDSSQTVHVPDDVRILIESPALAFVHAADTLQRLVGEGKIDSLVAFLRLLEFGDECCGSYRRDAFDPRMGEVTYDEPGQDTRLVDAEMLVSTMRKMYGTSGLKFARTVAGYVIDGSGSPMESYLNHAMTLPPRYAGHSLPKPLANKNLVVDDVTWQLLRHRSLKPDLQWPELRTLAEYLGDEWHSSKDARIEDKNRLQDYAIALYTAIPIMFDDIKNATALNKTVQLIARELMRNGAKRVLYHVREHLKDDEFMSRQRMLVSTLLPPVRGDESAGGYRNVNGHRDAIEHQDARWHDGANSHNEVDPRIDRGMSVALR